MDDRPAPAAPSPSATLAGGAVVAAVLLAVTLTLGRSNELDLDLFHEMALAREGLLAHSSIVGGLPTGDVFAFTPTHPVVVHHEWGTGAVLLLATAPFEALWPGWGWTGVMVLKWASLLATLALLAACACRRWRAGGERSHVPPPASAAVFAGGLLLAAPLLTGGVATVRAQNFTLLLTAALMAGLWADRAGRRWWVLGWLAAFVAWVNLHAGFLAGAGLFGLHVAERFVRALKRPGCLGASGTLPHVAHAVRDNWHLLAAAALLPALVLFNPYGTDLPPYLWRAVRMDRPRIAEWLPLWHTPDALLPWGTLVAGAVAAGWAFRARTGRLAAGWPLVAVAAWLALSSGRHGSLFAVVWLAHVPRWLGGTAFDARLAALPRTRPLVCGTLAAAFLWCAAADAVHRRTWAAVLPTSLTPPANGWEHPDDAPRIAYPAGATAFLRDTGRRGNVLTHFNHGAFVSWELYPSVRVSMDSRYEVAYPVPLVRAVGDLYRTRPGWERTLAALSPDTALVPTEAPLHAALTADAGWRAVYADGDFTLFEPSPSSRDGVPPRP